MSSLCRATLASLLLLQTAASLVPTSPSLRSSPPSLVKGRALGSILASLSGDAAAMPLHWLYNTSTIDELVHNDSARSDFFPTPSCPFYNYRFGENSPYVEERARRRGCVTRERERERETERKCAIETESESKTSSAFVVCTCLLLRRATVVGNTGDTRRCKCCVRRRCG